MSRKIIVTVLVCGGVAVAQEHRQFPHAIEDNSFFIEEAYNQERGVVQHIGNGLYLPKPQKTFALSFTQEWPLWGEEHQLSLSVPYEFVETGTVSGLGDVLVNYRYQLLGKEDWAAIAPRLSIVLPTGDAGKGRGFGRVGMQFNLPVSKRLSESFVAHVNCGLAITPGAQGFGVGGTEVRHTLSSYSVGASLIWLATLHFNVMLECLESSEGDFDQRGDAVRTLQTVISPGLRYAFDVENLQIVPGIALPFNLADGSVSTGAFFYLSFEHPF